MNIPNFWGNPTFFGGAIAATIAAAVASLFGASSVVPAGSPLGSINPESGQFAAHSGIIPQGAVRADAQKMEQLLRRGLKGVTYSGQSFAIRDGGFSQPQLGFPLAVGGSDGCNGFSGSARINADGTLEAFPGWRSTKMACLPDSGHQAYGRIVRTGMSIYTLGERIFLKNGNHMLEFRPA